MATYNLSTTQVTANIDNSTLSTDTKTAITDFLNSQPTGSSNTPVVVNTSTVGAGTNFSVSSSTNVFILDTSSTVAGGGTISAGSGTGLIIAPSNQPLTINVNDTVGGDHMIVTGGGGATITAGGSGNTTIQAGGGNNSIVVGSGSNSITTGSGQDAVSISSGGASTVNLGSGNDTVVLSGGGNNSVSLGTGDDHGTWNPSTVGGGSGLAAAAGSGGSTVDGGTGFNDFTVTGNLANFKTQVSGNGLVVTNLGSGASVNFTNEEYLQFSDGVIINAANQSEAVIARMYSAAFDRSADKGGLNYWWGDLDHNQSLHDIASNFLASQEWQTAHGNLSNTDFISVMYQNILGRAPDAAGQAYWLGHLNSGVDDRATVLESFAVSAEAQSKTQGTVNVITDTDHHHS